MVTPTRGDLLADLSGAVNELTEIRHHVETLESTVTLPDTEHEGRRKRGKRTRQRIRHIVELPSLLESLAEAMVPGSTGDPATVAGFESRPSAELEPVNVVKMIRKEAIVWCEALNVDTHLPLRTALSRLVGAKHTDQQLANLVRDAQRWVRRARLATGFDPAPITLNTACPYCGRRHAITVTGDLETARCSRCGVEWNHDTIGLLADMLTANQTQETMTAPACVWWPECQEVGTHDEHHDGAGRTWRDTCTVWIGTVDVGPDLSGTGYSYPQWLVGDTPA